MAVYKTKQLRHRMRTIVHSIQGHVEGSRLLHKPIWKALVERLSRSVAANLYVSPSKERIRKWKASHAPEVRETVRLMLTVAPPALQEDVRLYGRATVVVVTDMVLDAAVEDAFNQFG